MTSAARLAMPEQRVEGVDKVSGAALYSADVSRPGMLHATFVQSPHPHARVLSVDVTAAQKVPGVRAILTGEDTRPARFGRYLQDWPVLAWDRVRFIGDRVAAVAADTREAADEAARAISVSYEPLPAVFDVEAALAVDAPVLHADPSVYRALGKEQRTVLAHPNLQGRMVHEHGDVAGGFARAVRVFEHTFEVPRVHNGYLEPRACLVWLDGATVHVVTTNKAPFRLREQMAATLGLPVDCIDVESVTIGGDFGAKGLSLDEHACYFLARATGRPVRSVLQFTDELRTSTTRRSARIRLRTGVDADGRITAHDARIVFGSGAYAAGSAGARLMPGGSLGALMGYAVPAARLEALGVYTNELPGGSVRGPGQPQLMFASESHIDQIARELGRDPLAFREQNLAIDGQTTAQGETWHGSEMPKLIALVRRDLEWGGALPPGHGRGIALGFRHQGSGKATVRLSLSADGAVDVLTGVPEQGTGVLTVMRRVVAIELGIAPERVRVTLGTTSTAADDPGTGGSKSTIVHGGAALDGARRLAAMLAERAPGLSFQEAARVCAPLVVTGTFVQDRHAYGSCAQVVEVAVDSETGAMKIVHADVVADVGTVINPVGARGQLEGGFVFGLGQAVMEEVVLDEGRLVSTNLADYKLPTIGDIPPVRVITHTDDLGFGPYGAKSIGELVNPGVGPAVANAIADALGVRLLSLPVTSEKVLKSIGSARGRTGP